VDETYRSKGGGEAWDWIMKDFGISNTKLIFRKSNQYLKN